jgi:hypothetical protein
MQVIHIERQILALTDDQLEQFVRQWTTHKNEYLEVQRFTGPGDMGRDVVGYITNERHEGGLSRCPREPHMMYSGVAASHLRRARGGAQWQGHDL